MIGPSELEKLMVSCLLSIEWGGPHIDESRCPACNAMPVWNNGVRLPPAHKVDCALDEVLTIAGAEPRRAG